MRIVTVEEMRALEAAADAAGYSYKEMMETAGRAVADRIKVLLPDTQESRVLFLIGKGNNGGDGLVAARMLKDETVMTIGFVSLRDFSDEQIKLFVTENIPCIIFSNDKYTNYTATRTVMKRADVVVDAVLGTGAKLPLREDVQTLLKMVKQGLDERNAIPQLREKPIHFLAVDIPSGVDADTGQAAPETLPATETITFEALKPGHVCYPGAGLLGTLMVASLELPSTINYPTLQQVVTLDVVRPLMPKRPADANKGTFGKALVVAGSGQYIGAVALAAESAYRVGAGLVTVATPAPNVGLLAPRILEATWLELSHEYGAIDESAADVIWDRFPDYTAALIGPGLGTAEATGAFMDVLFPLDDKADPLPTTYPDPPPPSMAMDGQPAAPTAPEIKPPPLVIDADALNLLAKMDAWWKRLPPRTILTPHPGEMARLANIEAQGDKSPSQIVQRNRYLLAREKARAWNCVLVLKGANTIIADPDGRVAVIPVATPALSRAGTGDVLAGAIVGCLAQGLDPFDAAMLAAFIHGTAGNVATERLGTTASVLASDVLHAIPAAIGKVDG
ncbi:MAG: NAD(P)H-hydrate epimerase [Anaerolineae bacterium]|nr:NAD(P)H-hydrate epimerase [Anaerolineae bacterium]